jgi:hypothetical protein
MSLILMNEQEKEEEQLKLVQVTGKPRHIEVNERSLEETRKAFREKGLEITKHTEYPREDYYLIRKQKKFDSIVDPSKGIRKIIESMVRQPVTIFDKTGKAVVKDALYYRGYWRGLDKFGTDIGAPFIEGTYKIPRLVFSFVDPAHPFDSATGEKRGRYTTSGYTFEHTIFLSEDKKERRKQLEDIVSKCTGTHTGNLERGHLSYRNPSPDNSHSGTHGGMFTWDIFCDLSIEELGELQNKRYYTEKSTGQVKDSTGARVAYDHSTKKVETTKDR